MILFDLNSNPNNLVEILFIRVFLVDCFIRVFLVDCLTCLNISLIALKISKSSLSGLILINLQPSSCSIAFFILFCSQYFCRCGHFHQFLLRAYSHKNVSQSYNLKHYIMFAFFFLEIN